ncbi:MAG: hypothetical protein OEZ06_07565 [Myxococcales bacterium]|nr:hypothetical protein [Myxococcales bacterium]
MAAKSAAAPLLGYPSGSMTTPDPIAAAHGRRHSALALALCAFAYLYVFPYQSTLNNPNENVRFYMTAAIVEDGSYAIDAQRDRWGWVNDAAVHEGRVYSVKAPGTSLLGVPGYALYRSACAWLGRDFDRSEALWVCRLSASILPSLVWLFLFHQWLSRRGYHPALRDTTFFSVALGSLLYGYAMLFVSHTLSAAVAFSAFTLLYDAREAESPPRPRRCFWAGLFTAAVTLFEYPGLLCSLVLAVYGAAVIFRTATDSAERARSLGAFAAGGAIPTALVMHFQWRAFGSPFTPGHLMVENDALREAHHEGFFGAVGPSAKAFFGLLIDPGAGLLPLTPLLALAGLGLWIALRDRQQRPEALCVLSLGVLTVLAIASMNNWRGGWTVGPRYLAVMVPFMAWAALLGLERMAERIEAPTVVLALGATATGIAASGLPSAYYPHLPPEIVRPLPQLMGVLIAHDYAPPNAGNLLGVYGTASMAPLLVCALAALALCLRTVQRRRERLLLSVAALLLATTLALPLLRRPGGAADDGPEVLRARAFITRRWRPEGFDRAARLKAALTSSPAPAMKDFRTLSAIYAREGRTREARRALRGKL